MVYLCIPWDLASKLSNGGLSENGKCCGLPTTSVSVRAFAGYPGNEQRERHTEGIFVDQDLRITRERILIINKAIQDLNLTVCHPRGGFARTTECDIQSARTDSGFAKTKFAGGQELWKPRVIALQISEIVLVEPEGNDY